MSEPTVKTVVLLAALLLALPAVSADTRSDLAYFNEPAARGLWDQADVKGNFPDSVRYFVSEVKQTYCAIASSVIVLNSQGGASPVAPEI